MTSEITQGLIASAAEAQEVLGDEELDTNLCPICKRGLDSKSRDCNACIFELTELELQKGLEDALDGMSAMDLVSTVAGVHKLVEDEYFNKVIHNAYQRKVTEYHATEDPAAGGKEETDLPRDSSECEAHSSSSKEE